MRNSVSSRRNCVWITALAATLVGGGFVTVPTPAQTTPSAAASTETHVPVVFSGGHDTDPRDRGRPVILIAGALGVTPEVFRDAFSHVHPADPNVGPTRDEAQENKRALLGALAKYGVTNERLDAVSNYYRYVRSRGEMWPTRAAEAYAVLEKGVIKSYVVTSGGSGYSSAPTVTVPGVSGATAKVQLAFTKFANTNGSIASITVVRVDKP